MSQPPPPPRRRAPQVIVEPGAPPATPGGSSSGHRRRTWLLVTGAVVAVALITAVLVVVRSGSDPSEPAPRPASAAVQLTAATAVVESAGGAVEFPEDVKAQSMALLAAYVEAASVKPLRTGKVDDAALSSLFDPSAAPKLTGPDRATLVDEGFPKSDGNIKATSPSVTLTALAGTDGKVVLASATFDLEITAKGKKGAVHIKRTGSMVLGPGSGAWKITGWHLSVDRDGPGLPATPTTTVAGAATTKPSPTTTTKKQ